MVAELFRREAHPSLPPAPYPDSPRSCSSKATMRLRRVVNIFNPARTSSTLPSTQHIRWCEPVGGASLSGQVMKTWSRFRLLGGFCLAQGMDGPSGSCGFADDTALHTDGRDAIPAMHALVNFIGPLIKWLCMSLICMSKSYISAINFATGQANTH